MIKERIEQIRAKLEGMNISYVSRNTGESHQTIWRFSKGQNVNIESIIALDEYFQKLNEGK